jgi:putative transposase
MTYSLDMRERAICFVRSGGSQAEASRIFGVTTRTLRYWLARNDLAPKVCGPRRRKLDKVALAAHVRAQPDALLRERAAEFGVSSVAIFKALRQLGIRKKNDAVRGKSFR